MTLINTGSTAIDRGVSAGSGYTSIEKNNPANLSGRITTVEIWSYANLTDCVVGSLYVVSGNFLTTRDYEAIGNVASGAKRTFTVNFNVEAGDYIGIYCSGHIEADYLGGDGHWYKINDVIPCDNLEFSFRDAYTLSLYGIGTTEAEVKPNAIFMGCNF